MSGQQGYRVRRLSRARLALAAGQEMAGRRHLMFALVEADLAAPIQHMAQSQARCGEKLSLAGYVATCVARTLAEYPELNAFRWGRSLVLLDEVTREIRAEQASRPRVVAGQRWLERVPSVLVPVVMRWASRRIGWPLRYGVAGVSGSRE